MISYHIIVLPFLINNQVRDNVLIYDENQDAFYTTPRIVSTSEKSKNDIKLFSIGILFLGVSLVSSFLFDNFIATYIWNKYFHIIYLVFAILFAFRYSKRYFTEMNFSLNPTRYEASTLTLVETLQSSEQRRRWFSNAKVKFRIQKLVALLVIFTVFLIKSNLSLCKNYGSIELFATSCNIFIEVFLIFQTFFQLTDKSTKYLLHKFASKGE